jgi:hypothetical protein
MKVHFFVHYPLFRATFEGNRMPLWGTTKHENEFGGTVRAE